MATSEPAGLTADELIFYRTQGYVVPAWRFSDTDVAEMNAAVDAILAANPDHRPEQLVCPHLQGGATKPIEGEQYTDFFRFGTAVGLRRMLRQVVGDSVLMWGSQLFCKPAATGMALPWHQDGDYWPINPIATVSVWIAIDQAGPDNGGLRLIPGSHHRGPLPHVFDNGPNVALDQTVDPNCFNPASAVDISLKPGQVVLFDVHMIHGSNANTSGRRRAGLVYRYMPHASLFDRSYPDKVNSAGHLVSYGRRPLIQVVGKDPGPNTGVVALSTK